MRLFGIKSAVIVITLAISGCTITIDTLHTTQSTTQSEDCPGGANGCSLADHEKTQPIIAADLDTKIHDYLIRNPNVFGEMQQELRHRQEADRVTKFNTAFPRVKNALLNDPMDPILGNPKGDVTIVEFFDDECPYCKALSPALERLVEIDPNVRIVLKQFAILGQGSITAARYALAANRQGKYATLHHLLMTSTIPEHQLKEDDIKRFGTQAGLNVPKLTADSHLPEIDKHISDTKSLAVQLGIDATPALILDGQLHASNTTAEALANELAAIRQRRLVDKAASQ